MLIFDWLNSARSVLENLSETATLDSQVILSHVLQENRSYLLAHLDRDLTNHQNRKATKCLNTVLKGIPLPYVLGKWDFYNRTFIMSKKVLIPRPETELMVEQALRWLGDHPNSRHVADVGTGSACVVISLAMEYPTKIYYATDSSKHAINLASKNIRQNNLDQIITLFQTSFLNRVNEQFDLICANLPYIPASRLQLLGVNRPEPIRALDGGADGFRLIELFLSKTHRWLKPQGCILCEIDDTHAEIAKNLAGKYWPQKKISIHQDLSGKTRSLVIK